MANDKKTGCMGAILVGPLPRSDGTASVHRLFRDGHAAFKEFEAAIQKDRKEILARQAGFAFLTGGQADWLDLLRPFAQHFQGFEKRQTSGDDSAGPVTRWFRTNTFYRKPNVVGKIDCEGAELASCLPQIERGVLYLLGPYTFTRLVENTHYGSAKMLAQDYLASVAKSVPGLRKKGYGCIILTEPSVGYEMSKNSFDGALAGGMAQGANLLKGAGIKVGIHFPLANAAKALPFFEKTNLDFFGIDGIHSDFSNIVTGKDVLLGLVDGARAGIEELAELERQEGLFIKNAKFSGNYFIGSNDRLTDVPFRISLQKAARLGELSVQLQKSDGK